MSLVKKISTNFGSLGEIILFSRIVLLAMILPMLLKLPLPRMLEILTPRPPIKNNRDAEALCMRIVGYVEYILKKDRLNHRNFCLKRSLLLYRFLRQAGVEVRICFGIRRIRHGNAGGVRAAGKLEGHAWLSVDEKIFLEANPDVTRTYLVTYTFP